MYEHSKTQNWFDLIRCTTKAELRLARQFRSETFRARRGMELDSLQERRRDESSHVMLLTRRGIPCATARAQSYPGSGLLPEIAPELPDFGADSEVGRIAALSTGECVKHSVLLLTLGAMWLTEHTEHRRYVAYCHPKLVPLYQLLGAADTGMAVDVEGRPTPYSIVVGDYSAAVGCGLTQLHRAGVSFDDAVAAIRWKYGSNDNGRYLAKSVS